ncbi:MULTISPECIES: SAF domain-containing protein [Streptacidiphilus]|uniref:SAF domain-containing protein n=1 Tax=Streptacidiphilus cavernicola TaxID=3342716 RepID=A0ABV6UW84_9ACTN|nr:SAF domain-containing protein [Streptacidiphilus jeojiense]
MAITRQRQAPTDNGLAPAPVQITETAPRRARRPMLMVAGIAVAAVGALGAYTMVNQVGNRVAVIALAHPVPKGQVLVSADLTVAQVAPDPALQPIAAADSSSVLGKTAAVDLPAGTLLTRSSVQAGAPLTTGKSVVGVLAKPGMIPAGRLQPGQAVTVVQTPTQSAGGKLPVAPLTISAVVVSVSAADSNGNQVVDLAADPADAPQLAVWSAAGQDAIVTAAGH